MHEHKHEDESKKGKRLFFSIFFNLSIVMAEIIGGLVSRSTALLSDAAHNSADVLSMIFSYSAVKISQRSRDEKFTYGYRRAEVIAAVVNSVFLMVVGGFVTFEGIKKLISPEAIDPKVMLPVAIIGLAGNILTILFLHEHHHDINVHSTLVHITADAISSVLVVTLGIVLFFKPLYFLDGLISLVIAVYMIYMGWQVFKKASSILMQVKPEWIDLNDLKTSIENLDGVRDVHHIHVWTMNGEDGFAELHVTLQDKNVDADSIRESIRNKLKELGISHSTVQIEFKNCEEVSKQILNV